MRISILFFVILIPSVVWPETSVNITGGSVGKAMITPSSLSEEFSFDSGMDENIGNFNPPFAGQFHAGYDGFIESPDAIVLKDQFDTAVFFKENPYVFSDEYGMNEGKLKAYSNALNSLELENNEFMNTWGHQSRIKTYGDISVSSFPFSYQIKSIKLIDGTIIQAENFNKRDEFGNNLASYPSESQVMTRRKDFRNIGQHKLGLRWEHDLQEEENASEIDMIGNYQRFLNQYLKTGEIGNEFAGFNDVNIYHRFIEMNREVLDEQKLKALFRYWYTDLSSPAQLPRYQYNPDMDWRDSKNFNWDAVHEDINDTVHSWLETYAGKSFSTIDSSVVAYRYGDRIYINPYQKDIAEVQLEDGLHLDMSMARDLIAESNQDPAMIDLSLERVQSILLKNGQEIFVEDLNVLRKLMIDPNSYNLDGIIFR